ncbi:alpha-amylase family protein [Halegenticoccus soli]|uniref:hypothetical protein n=1 Tax=Halegenticoccus soli TaxID=1985678 RepID=UPI000C6DCEFF|nr:hypothetical protein [Halegenticoccus soli]
MEQGASYFGVRDPRHVEEDLDRLVDEGLNAILHTYSERDQTFYEETMADIVAASNDRGFTTYVNPWGVGKVFGGEAFSQFLGKYPNDRQQLVTGSREHAACFNSPAFREFVREWTRSAVGLDPDVVFWDEPHWILPEWFDDDEPDDAWVCRCEHCQRRYREKYDAPMPVTEDATVRRFREDTLLDFLDEMMAIVHEGGAENAVCLVPESDADHGIADWARLASSDYIDLISTDPYWGLFAGDDVEAFVRDAIDRVTDLASTYDLRSQIWVQGFGLPDETATYDHVRTTTRSAAEGGVDSVFMWGYDGCRSISSIASENPDRVWESYLDALSG